HTVLHALYGPPAQERRGVAPHAGTADPLPPGPPPHPGRGPAARRGGGPSGDARPPDRGRDPRDRRPRRGPRGRLRRPPSQAPRLIFWSADGSPGRERPCRAPRKYLLLLHQIVDI